MIRRSASTCVRASQSSSSLASMARIDGGDAQPERAEPLDLGRLRAHVDLVATAPELEQHVRRPGTAGPGAGDV